MMKDQELASYQQQLQECKHQRDLVEDMIEELHIKIDKLNDNHL